MWYSAVGCIVTLILSLLAAPLTAEAQQRAKVPRIGILIVGTASTSEHNIEAFRQGLRELGWVEGHNITLEYRYAEGQYERLPVLAAELVRFPVEILFAASAPAAKAAKHATTTMPIVFEALTDPVSAGLVESLARPGGNLTGTAGFLPELSGKRLQLLRDVVPGLTRVAVLVNPANPGVPAVLQETERAAWALGIQLHVLEVRDPGALRDAFAAMTRTEAQALLLVADPVFVAAHRRIADLAIANRLPMTSEVTAFAEAGGLMTYGVSLPALWRRAASYVDKILKGASPGELPIERPVKFELVINLKTAKTLGLTMPPSLLFQADAVIQ